MQKITPFLWFNNNAEEAIQFYTSVFPDTNVKNIVRYTKAGPGPEGTLMTAVFELQGQELIALNGGPHFTFTEAISFVVNCENQEEVDDMWKKLSAGGEKSRCGWLKDKFGLSWQVVPTALPRLLSSENKEAAKSVMEAMLKMDKIEISLLQEAYDKALEKE